MALLFWKNFLEGSCFRPPSHPWYFDWLNTWRCEHVSSARWRHNVGSFSTSSSLLQTSLELICEDKSGRFRKEENKSFYGERSIYHIVTNSYFLRRVASLVVRTDDSWSRGREFESHHFWMENCCNAIWTKMEKIKVAKWDKPTKNYLKNSYFLTKKRIRLPADAESKKEEVTVDIRYMNFQKFILWTSFAHITNIHCFFF